MRAQRYFQKHGIFDPFIIGDPCRDLEIVVVIPAYREHRLFDALQSLMRCEPLTGKVEILVVLNYPESEREEMESFHRRQYERLLDLQESLSGSAIGIKAIPPLAFEDRHAGVGLARKAGMDEAVRRFEALGKDGIILNFDADCLCDPSYLRSVEDYFHQHPDRQAVSIGFRHVLQQLDDAHVRAIQLYEIHLRAYIGWQKLYRYPFAFQTLGSCFAVRSRAYQLQGGMNRRKAGEDFYFLHKFSLIGQLGELPQVLVFPSGRSSTRVPFGTGKAVAGLLSSEGTCKSYHPKGIAAFCNFMKSMQDEFSSFRKGGSWRDHCTLASIRAYMNELDLDAKIAEALAHAGSGPAFGKRIAKCFDPFHLMKYLHKARALEFPDVDVRESALELIAATTNAESPSSDNPEELLQRLIALGY